MLICLLCNPATWAHFLGVHPWNMTSWVTSGLLLRCSPCANRSQTGSPETPSPQDPPLQVTLICFNAAAEFWEAINRVYHSDTWVDILDDPYVLVGMVFESWYECADASTWAVNDQCQKAERVGSVRQGAIEVHLLTESPRRRLPFLRSCRAATPTSQPWITRRSIRLQKT